MAPTTHFWGPDISGGARAPPAPPAGLHSKDFDAKIYAHSVSSAVRRIQCPFGHLWIMCNPFQGSNSLRGANNLFREIENSLREVNNLFRESENSFWGEIYNRL